MARYAGPIVDAHHHLWSFGADRYPWLTRPGSAPLARDFTADDYRAEFAGFPIVATVWIEALAADPEAEIAEAMHWHARNPALCNALVAHVPLDADDARARLDRLMAMAPGLRGVRDIVSWAEGRASFARRPDLLMRPAFARGLAALRDRDLSLDLMLLPPQLEDAARLLATVPGLKVAVEHAASPEDQSPAGLALWRRGLERIAALPGAIVKVSALQVLQPDWTLASLARILEPLVALFGPGRLAYGSDFPTHDLACRGRVTLDAVLDLTSGWSPDDQHAFFAGTAARFYRIPLPREGTAAP